MVTVKGVVTLPRILGRVIAGKLRFEVVYNSHFYNYSIYKSVVIVTVKVGVVTFPKYLEKKLLLVSSVLKLSVVVIFIIILYIGASS